MLAGMDTFPDLGSLSDQELKDLIQQLTEEEVDISYKRRILHGKIDILRAELVNRLRKKHEGGEEVITGDDVQKLSDIFLDDVTVSRDHALLVRRSGDYYLDDLGSLNGTYVNRHRIESHRLDDGDELQVGKFKLTYISR